MTASWPSSCSPPAHAPTSPRAATAARRCCGALLGSPRGRRPTRARAAQLARRCGARAVDLIDELAGTPRSRRAPRLLPSARWLSRLAALRRSAGDPRRGARLGGEERPRRGDRPARRARRRPRRRSVPRHPAHLGGCNGRAAAIRRLVELGADVNGRGTFGGPDHGAGRDRPPSRCAVRPDRGGRDAARARRRPDDLRRHPRRDAGGLGALRRPSRARKGTDVSRMH